MDMDVDLRLGYVVPEFPGQTHGFFWRELDVLRRLHVSPDVVSTRRPEGQLRQNRSGRPKHKPSQRI